MRVVVLAMRLTMASWFTRSPPRLGRRPEAFLALVEVGPENLQFFGDDLNLRHTPMTSRRAISPKLLRAGHQGCEAVGIGRCSATEGAPWSLSLGDKSSGVGSA